MTESRQLVSVVVPLYNEESNLLRCLNSIRDQDFGCRLIDLILSIAECEDETENMARNWAVQNANRFYRILIVKNHKKSLAAGWNLGVREANFDLVMLSSGHFFMRSDYISRLYHWMKTEKDVFTIGGNIIPDSEQTSSSYFSQLLKKLYQTRSLVGSANYRVTKEENIDYLDFRCDTACFGFYRKDVFLKIGGFNEELTRSQDFELHCRLKKLGLKKARSVLAVGEYKLRIEPWSAMRYAYINGYWIARPLRKYPYVFRLRHSIPFLFTLIFLVLLILSAFCNLGIIGLALLCISYTTYIITGLHRFGVKDRIVGLVLAFTFHILYGVGYGRGLSSCILTPPPPSARKDDASPSRPVFTRGFDGAK